MLAWLSLSNTDYAIQGLLAAPHFHSSLVVRGEQRLQRVFTSFCGHLDLGLLACASLRPRDEERHSWSWLSGGGLPLQFHCLVVVSISTVVEEATSN